MNKLEQLFELNNEDLYENLGKDILKSTGILPVDRQQYIKIAKEWMRKKYKEIVAVLCTEEAKNKIKEHDNKLSLASIILDLISPIFTGVPLATIAVLLTKEGIEKICKEKT